MRIRRNRPTRWWVRACLVVCPCIAWLGCDRTPNATAPAAEPTSAGDPARRSSIESVPPSPSTGCPALVSGAWNRPGTVHSQNIVRNETWTAEGSPHRFPSGALIHPGATVSVTPCALILVGRGRAFEVGPSAAVMAMGEAPRPIRFDADGQAPGPGDWVGVVVARDARPTTRFLWNVIEHGGGGDESTSALACIVNHNPALDLVQVTARACRGHGVASLTGGGFAESAAHLRVLGTLPLGARRCGAMLFDDADAVRTLPDGEYTGNSNDEITIAPTPDRHAIHTTGTWRDPGVPYRIESNRDVVIDGDTSPALTIAPGTTVSFEAGAGLVVGFASSAALIADGRSDATRIQFVPARASSTAPPVWNGIALGTHFDAARTRIHYATIRGATRRPIERSCGIAATAADLAILRVASRPTRETLAHVHFVGTPMNDVAIGRDWRGESLDFSAADMGNEFPGPLSFACRQPPVHDEAGRCPRRARCE